MPTYKGVATDEMEKLLSDMQASLTSMTIDVVPVEGGTVTLPSTNRELIINLNPAANLNALTLVLPNEASSKMGQRVFIASTRQIATLTATGTSTVNNPTVMFSPGDNYVYFKNKPNTWSRIIG